MPLIETPEEFLTEEIWKSGFRGIFIGGCIERKEGSSFRARAHAHCYKKFGDVYFGYICVRSAKRLYTPSGQVSRLLWHEMAHIVTQSTHGNKKFWMWLKQYGKIRIKDKRRFKYAKEV